MNLKLIHFNVCLLLCLQGAVLDSEQKKAPELPVDAAAIVNGERIPEKLVQIFL